MAVLDEQLRDVDRAVQMPDESTRALAMTKLAREVGDAAISRAAAKAFDVGGPYDAMRKFDRESHLLAQSPLRLREFRGRPTRNCCDPHADHYRR